MKFLILILTLTSLRSFAVSEAKCKLVNGIYTNSTSQIANLKFETLVDIFTLRNANTLSFTLEGQKQTFIRSNITSSRHTKLVFLQKKNNKVFKVMYMLIDRTPREITVSKEFFGNMIISPEFPEDADFISIYDRDTLNYNFYCSF